MDYDAILKELGDMMPTASPDGQQAAAESELYAGSEPIPPQAAPAPAPSPEPVPMPAAQEPAPSTPPDTAAQAAAELAQGRQLASILFDVVHRLATIEAVMRRNGQLS